MIRTKASSSTWRVSATPLVSLRRSRVALTKPIIVIKVGRTQAAAKAAASHTGLAHRQRRGARRGVPASGRIRVNSIAELFEMAEVLAKQPRPRTPRLAIVTNAGGLAALDRYARRGGGQIAQARARIISKRSINCCRRTGAGIIRWIFWAMPVRALREGSRDRRERSE